MSYNEREKRELEKHEPLHKKFSTAFSNSRDKLTYYLLSLPFVLLGIAIASYRSPPHLYLVLLEIVVWILLLIAGGFGISAKWSEVEIHRQSATKHETIVGKIKDGTRYDDKGGLLPSLDREPAIMAAETSESRKFKLHRNFLIIAASLWILSRAATAVCSTWET